MANERHWWQRLGLNIAASVLFYTSIRFQLKEQAGGASCTQLVGLMIGEFWGYSMRDAAGSRYTSADCWRLGDSRLDGAY